MKFKSPYRPGPPLLSQPHEGQKFLGKGLGMAIGTLLLIVLWIVLGRLIFNRSGYEQFHGFLPLPTFKALISLLTDKGFWMSVTASLRRVGIGIGFAFLIGLPMGLLIGFYYKIRALTTIPIQFLRMISPLAWMPIALLVFARFESAIYFLITISTIWPIMLNTAVGAAGVNPQWLQMALNQGASNRQLILRIVLPATMPYIFTSLRLALGVAWIVLVPAEYLGVTSGLGYIINDARDTLEYDRLMATVVAIGLIGFILDATIQFLESTFYSRFFAPSRY